MLDVAILSLHLSHTAIHIKIISSLHAKSRWREESQYQNEGKGRYHWVLGNDWKGLKSVQPAKLRTQERTAYLAESISITNTVYLCSHTENVEQVYNKDHVQY